MEPLTVVSELFKVVTAISAMIQSVETNQQQLQRLHGRIVRLLKSVECHLQQKTNSELIDRHLNDLQSLIYEIQKYVQNSLLSRLLNGFCHTIPLVEDCKISTVC